MKRRVYNTAVVTSLVLFFVVMGLWVASGFYEANISTGHLLRGNTLVIAQGHGVIVADWAPSRPGWGVSFDLRSLKWFSMIPPSDLDHGLWLRFEGSWTYINRDVTVPHWFLAFLTLILPTVWLIRRRRHNSDPEAVPCAKCGYDLRGSSGGACPECGDEVASQRVSLDDPDKQQSA